MGNKDYKPSSPGRRFARLPDGEEITRSEPEDSLTESLDATGGRNNEGRMTVRHRGGGHKRRYRQIDFARDKTGVPGTVASVEYDPNRTAYIALVHYEDGEKRYILAPQDLEPGDEVISAHDAEIEAGNAKPLEYMPVGTVVHNVELTPEKGGQLARSAGCWAQLVAKEGDYGLLKLPSSEHRRVLLQCRATVGAVSNPEHENVSLGKAGRNRWKGNRPSVRGVAMNPFDHPHGGGEGAKSEGDHPVTPWGQLTKGGKTRHNKRTDPFIEEHRDQEE